jgi:hypothetical protein
MSVEFAWTRNIQVSGIQLPAGADGMKEQVKVAFQSGTRSSFVPTADNLSDNNLFSFFTFSR